MTPQPYISINLSMVGQDIRQAAADLARTDQAVNMEKLAQVTCIPLTTLRRWVTLRGSVTS